jgi:hypothetical protein
MLPVADTLTQGPVVAFLLYISASSCPVVGEPLKVEHHQQDFAFTPVGNPVVELIVIGTSYCISYICYCR